MLNLQDKVVILTGASQGIGAATAQSLAKAGATVVACARNKDACEKLAEDIKANGGKALGLACDVTDFAAVAALVARVKEEFGRIDALINNAGMVDPIARAAETDPEAAMTCLRVNVGGVFAAVAAVLPIMTAQGGGSIINVSSGAAHNPLEGWSAYCASKAALAMYTRSLALEYGDQGVRVFGFGPGVVDTGMQVKIRASGINPVSQLDRSVLASPARPAQVMTWLLTSDADDLAGQELSIRDEDLQSRAGLEVLS
ncbi:SDR family NAD(P)-dependent oxidoreductase [Rhodovibrionaceae bacterium A322]